jgi:AraC family transcriptional activator of pobA
MSPDDVVFANILRRADEFLNGFFWRLLVLLAEIPKEPTMSLRTQPQSPTPVPTYMLFGESTPWPTPEMLHCESIAARSRLHNWQISTHRHHGLFQILHLRHGRAEVWVDDSVRVLCGGQLTLVPQMCIHGFRFEKDAQGHVVTLAYPLIQKLAQHAGDALAALTSPVICSLDSDEQRAYLPAAFAALEAQYRGASAFRGLQVEALLAGILVMIGSRLAQPTGADLPRRGAQHFPTFCELIEQHYAEHRPVPFYARRLGITAAHLNALCRQAVGKSALELVHQRVILEAKRNLVYTSMTISVVSNTAGFADPAYFTRFFKRQVGMSPREFRLKAGTLHA